MKNQDKSVFLK